MKKAIKYSKLLQEVGLTKDQAETHLEILEEIVDVDLATKSDIFKLDSKINGLNSKIEGIEGKIEGLEGRMDGLESRMDGVEKSINYLRSEFEVKTTALEHRLMYKLSLVMTTGLAAMTAISKLIL